MSRAAWIALLFASLLAAPATAEKSAEKAAEPKAEKKTEKSAQPPRAEPKVVTIHSFDPKAGLTLSWQEQGAMRETETKTLERDGKHVEQTIEVVTFEHGGDITSTASTAMWVVTEVSGKKVPEADYAKRFKPGTQALLVEDGRPLDEFYREFFKPDTLVLTHKNLDRAVAYEYDKPHPTKAALKLLEAGLAAIEAYFPIEIVMWSDVEPGGVDAASFDIPAAAPVLPLRAVPAPVPAPVPDGIDVDFEPTPVIEFSPIEE